VRFAGFRVLRESPGTNSQEHMVEQLHRGRFHPARGLAEGKLENYWETAEPVSFYD